MEKLGDTLTVEALNPGYIKIFDKDHDGDIYIEQYQASRGHTKLKRQKIRRRNKVLILLFLSIILILAIFFIVY